MVMVSTDEMIKRFSKWVAKTMQTAHVNKLNLAIAATSEFYP